MKTDQDIENMLKSTKREALTAMEKASMKSEILTYAATSLEKKTTLVISPWSNWVLRYSVSFASFLFIFAGTTYASQDSLPGEALYPLKVHVLEEMILFTKIDAEEKLAYDISLMEIRFEELEQLLAAEEVPTSETLAIVADQIDEHVNHAAGVMKNASKTEITTEEKVEVIAKINQLTEAQSVLTAQNEEFTTIVPAVDEANDRASNVLNTNIEEFVATETKEEVQAYLSEQITEVSTAITGTTTSDIATYLQDVQAALAEGQTDVALISIFAAQEAVSVEKLLETSDDE
jgi:hypothetical protein